MDAISANPWISMWVHPRRTIRQIVETNPERKVLLLAAISGIPETLSNASTKSSGDHVSLGVLLALALLLGPVGGLLSLVIGGFLLRVTGRWIGGTADSRNVRCALAWASIPSIWSLALWLPAIWIFGNELFTEATPNIDANPVLAGLFLAFYVLSLVLTLWAFVIVLHAVGEVQGFSAWRALGSMVLAILLFLVPLLLIIATFAFAIPFLLR